MESTLQKLAFWHQPIIDLDTGEIIGQEWLVRGDGDETAIPLWRHAAQTGMIAQYEQMILNTLMAHRQAGDTRIWTVNLHPQGIVQTIITHQAVWMMWQKALNPVVWEALEAPNWDIEKARALSLLGSPVWLDDWGDGPDTSQRLTVWPIKGVKLDLPLLHRAMHYRAAGLWVQTITQFAREQGLMVIAEGLETADHIAIARDLGVRYAQGWACGVPLLDTTIRVQQE
ncbi:MAG: diguanylate phosphodiesterase [Sulfobacillus benefaciens]|uniref:Diguanylate phosphodiesterase n=1 Tax=Sulfobacillus benefaciens TaxID=453960 RepID=A0A2T2WY32_9FIRM|nr:MAG: diguanylate phosphodiesterase [Sulfobacillus benefaciens]